MCVSDNRETLAWVHIHIYSSEGPLVCLEINPSVFKNSTSDPANICRSAFKVSNKRRL